MYGSIYERTEHNNFGRSYDAGLPLGSGKASRQCPTCRKHNALSATEARRGYQCMNCTRRAEGGL